MYGHLIQVASTEAARTVLLRCPRCSSWYEQDPASGATARIDESTARRRFPVAE
jgi:hypothetical protein